MAVTVDHEPLATDRMGFETVGQVLAHVQRDNRLVTSLLIDGQAPDLDRMATLRQALLNGRSIFIETADPAEVALEVLGEVEAQLDESDRLRAAAIDLLHQNQPARAIEKLGGCFGGWQVAREAVLKTAQLLRIDLGAVRVGHEALIDVVNAFAEQLRQIKQALEHRDYVTLGDILAYEAGEATDRWRQAVSIVRRLVTAR